MRQIGALFDLDGVLLDSEGCYTQFWDSVDARFPTGIPNFSTAIKGSNLHEILHNHYDSPQVRQQVTEMLDNFQREMSYEFFEGAMEFVQRLNEAHVATCVVTSSDQKKMDSLHCQHPDFQAHFQAIVTGDMVSHAKPHPECFLLGAQMIGADIKDCIVFEDSINGLFAGRAAGATVVGLATTLPRTLIEPLADFVIDKLRVSDEIWEQRLGLF